MGYTKHVNKSFTGITFVHHLSIAKKEVSAFIIAAFPELLTHLHHEEILKKACITRKKLSKKSLGGGGG